MMKAIGNKNKSALFLKAKEKAINFLEKYYKDKDSWANDKIDKVANLPDWPSNMNDLQNVPASAKGIILKAHLKHLYPDSKFSVVNPHFGSLDVKFLGGAYPFGLKNIDKIYCHPCGSDLQSDYYNYDLSILFINDLNGDQWFYDGPDEIIHALDKLIDEKKKFGGKLDKHIHYYADLIGVKSV